MTDETDEKYIADKINAIFDTARNIQGNDAEPLYPPSKNIAILMIRRLLTDIQVALVSGTISATMSWLLLKLHGPLPLAEIFLELSVAFGIVGLMVMANNKTKRRHQNIVLCIGVALMLFILWL